MKVKKQYLLLLACLVWIAAGANIVRIGFEEYPGYLTAFNIFLSVVVFAVFQFFIFGKLVKKHTKRIIAYEERQWFIKFFDVKSFIIMAFMMTGESGFVCQAQLPSASSPYFTRGWVCHCS